MRMKRRKKVVVHAKAPVERDTSRFTDWSPETVEFVEVVPQSPPPPSSGAVVYEADKVTAYFDATGRSVPKAFATWAKVWTPDSSGSLKLEIVSLTEPLAPTPLEIVS